MKSGVFDKNAPLFRLASTLYVGEIWPKNYDIMMANYKKISIQHNGFL